MTIDDVRLLLVRPADLAVAALRFLGFEAGPAGVTATSATARIEVTLPPQATAEAPWAAGVLSVARVGGPSRLTFAVAAGTVVPLTADGVLSALATAPVVHDDAPSGAEPLSVELPWHIRFAPRPAVAGDVLRCDLSATSPLAPNGVSGLWHLRLEAAGGLALVPIGTDPDVEGLLPPLDQGHRDILFAQASAPAAPPTAPYLDLSPLGGTMSASGDWPAFSWDHQVVLGRDMAVRTESRGLLYPFGHRAVLVKTSQRQLLPAGGGPADAGLQEESWLIVADPVRGRSTDAVLARQLPFDEVEVLERVVPLGVPGERTVVSRQRLPQSLDALHEEKVGLQQQLQEAEAAIAPLVEETRQAIAAGGEAEKAGPASQLAPILDEIGRQQQRQADSAAWDAAHPPHFEIEEVTFIGPDGEPSTTTQQVEVPGDANPDPWGQRDQDFLNGLVAQAGPLEAQIAAIDESTRVAIEALVDEDSFLAAGGALGDAVARVRQLRVDVPRRVSEIEAVEAEAQQVHPVAVWPLGQDGTTLRLPIRCDGLHLTMPVLFLHDEDLGESADWHAFAPLSEQDVRDEIALRWGEEQGRHAAVPGIPVDLVRDATPAPNDVLPVQRLSFGGGHDGSGFRAVVEEAQVLLAAVQELVPGADGAVNVAYREAYRLRGEAEHAVLELRDRVEVSFRTAADRAGGLVAPEFTADVLSRLHGPVPAGALVGLLPQQPDLSTVFGATTLLGMPLGALLAPLTEAVPKPLTIVPEPGGGARMSWSDLTLEDHGPLRVTPGRTKLELSVVTSPAATTTTCHLDEFALVLPPGPVELVRLDFASLRFTQEPGRPPDLDVQGLKVRIGGDLGLLEALQSAVQLDDVAPRVRTSADGMSVDYTLAVPEVTAGMFLMQNIAVRAAVDVPFDGRPIVTTLAFASRDKPFHLGVSVFGGGGYLVFEIDNGGIRTLEASLDFGAAVAINVGIAKAEVHALGGVRFNLVGDEVKVSGFLRIGGSVDVLGLVSVTVELRVELTYDAPRLTGRATAVIEIDVTFWSGSIELDSGEYTFIGGAEAAAIPPSSSISVPPPTLPDWQRYRDAYGAA
ncbi:hypothetical protein QI633_19860 [Nocardioides sp. QY071]|uniref:hypothetical protein n=1 Tax=Nocardioides sp. QY071 TaxID=3044187 RepID=UPI00249A55F3|nr:hypothetical protein [Nocardioides sp. QY071]WGY00781.1 hypothetical protein QI633_19860 [Nocardioides sp. QY071]